MELEPTDGVAELKSRLESIVKERDQLLVDLYGTGKFTGPCFHGHDPWTRCEECGEGTSLDALMLIVSHIRK